MMNNSSLFPQRHCPDMEPHKPHVWEEASMGLGSERHWSCLGSPRTPAPLRLSVYIYGTEDVPDKAKRILQGPALEALNLYVKRASDYTDADGFDPSEVLGVQGQFAEVWRKVWKLKNSMWDGREMVGEGPREILMDLIGHCLLAIDMIDNETPMTTKDAA